MQNILNLRTPFYKKDGITPVRNGRVHFLTLETPDEYIHIYDTDGTELQNPLPLNDNGVLEPQPFAPDYMDFKMVVEAPTTTSASLLRIS